MRTSTCAALVAAALLAACNDAAPAARPTSTSPASGSAAPLEPAPASATCPTSPALADALTTANPGATLHLRAPRDCAGIRANATWTGGRLVVFSGGAIGPSRLYEDGNLGATAAPNRVLFSAVNSGSAPLRFAVVLTNLASSGGSLTLERAGATSPVSPPRRALERWLTSSAGTPVNVAPGASTRLDPLFGDAVVQPGARVEGIWDYAFDRPHRLELCALAPEGPAECAPLPLASRDGQVRGTFAWNERLLETSRVEPRAGVARLPLSALEQRGLDAPTGASVTLPNNLGVLRRVRLPALADGEPNVALVLASRAPGAAARASAGITPGGAVPLPELLPEGAGALLGTFAPDDGPISIEYLATPGASPAELVAVPF